MNFALISAMILSLVPLAHADEGMWLFNSFPYEKVKKAYGFTPKQEWLDHVRLSSVRLAGGCSGSFISDQGLVMTNHHCAHSCIEQLSTPQKDFVASGFYAAKADDEVRCPEIEVNRLEEITDVTARIAKVTNQLEGQKYNDALKAEMSKIEKECAENSELKRCDVVTLFQGGKYHLYRYSRFQDVRLAFAPELKIAFFGGDPDNFMFPRYDLDMSLLRVYENGQPLKTKDFFRWSAAGAKEGDLTFVTGHPGRTSRLLTVAELEYQRDVKLIKQMTSLSELRGILTEFQNRGPEQKRIAGAELFGVENALKAIKGKHQALLSSRFMEKKRAEEKALILKVNQNPKWKAKYASAWTDTARALEQLKEVHDELTQLESNHDLNSSLFSHAKRLLRVTEELTKPNEIRLREYTDSKLPAIKQEVMSSAPIYDEFEIAMLTFSLTKIREILTVDHPAVKKILGVRSPYEVAESAVKSTRLKDIEFRKSLFEKGKAAVDASHDSMIELARLMDGDARAVRKKVEDQIESVLKKSAEKIAKAKFDIIGTGTYPDATFTLRISHGAVQGYRESGRSVSPLTYIEGAFARHTGRDPFALPETWIKAQSRLNMKSPLNMCTTNDIIGGNSGSPVINKNAEIVGLIFDGNIQSLGGDYGFDASVNRAVAVHSSGILEALKNVYSAHRLVSEIEGKLSK